MKSSRLVLENRELFDVLCGTKNKKSGVRQMDADSSQGIADKPPRRGFSLIASVRSHLSGLFVSSAQSQII